MDFIEQFVKDPESEINSGITAEEINGFLYLTYNKIRNRKNINEQFRDILKKKFKERNKDPNLVMWDDVKDKGMRDLVTYKIKMRNRKILIIILVTIFLIITGLILILMY